MKYKKQIVFLLLVNLIVVFLSIFTGNLTRKLEITNNQKKISIEKEKEQLQINKIEYSFYNNSDYLKKLHKIYFTLEEDHPERNVLSLSNILDMKKERTILVNIK
tara:strand:- start:714 stop:1028 length:315 start_codon:yes stop_codon:yes gene_type:complete